MESAREERVLGKGGGRCGQTVKETCEEWCCITIVVWVREERVAVCVL